MCLNIKDTKCIVSYFEAIMDTCTLLLILQRVCIKSLTCLTVNPLMLVILTAHDPSAYSGCISW